MILHPTNVSRAVYYGLRWRLKRLLRIPDRPRNHVVGGDSEEAFLRHLRICRLLKAGVEPIPADKRGTACEIGCGDCLSTSDLLLGSGFTKIYLVEKQPIVVDERQKNLLHRLAQLPELPNAEKALTQSNPPVIDSEKITVVPEFFEAASLPRKVDLIFSFDVVEHVEDLPGFFKHCSQFLEPGGTMIHKFDLSGHEFFEDPMPPLDFQTYPNWLYSLMFPKYRRACRRFLDEIVEAAISAGFEPPKIEVLRAADAEYVKALRPSLRKEAQGRSIEQLTPLDVVLSTKLK